MAKTVLIAGGARGIGKYTSIVMGQKGWNVAFTSRNEKLGKEFEKELIDQGINATFYKLDVTDEDAVKNTIDAVIAKYGRMDCIVNNAGIGGDPRLFAECTTENFRNLIDTNLMGVYYGMKYAVRYFLESGGGSIVNVSSIAGINGLATISMYDATKHAIVGLTKTVAVEYAEKNIRVNAVAPGFCRTEILDDYRKIYNTTDEDFGALHPMNRMGDPREVATAIAFLANDEESSFITGAILCVDGGYSAR